jgi:hypothetical protein
MTLRCSTISWSYGDNPAVLVMLWKVWNDSVWSKVIATGITAGLAGMGAFWTKHLEYVFEALDGSVPIPVWLVLGAVTLFAALVTAVIALWCRKRAHVQDADAQPNAVLVELVPPKQS